METLNSTIKDKNGKHLIDFCNHFIKTNSKNHPHTHHYLEISWVKEGNGIYYINEKTYDMKKGDVFIISNTESHVLSNSSNMTLVNSVIHFEPEFIWSISSNDIDYQFIQIFFERNKNFSNRLDRDNPTSEKIYSLLEEIEQEFINKLPAYPLMIKVKLQTIFAEIIRNYDYIPTKSTNNLLSETDMNEIHKVLTYINDHLCEDISLKDLADLVHMSPSYFSSFFKKFNGLTPFEYIISKRIQKAIEYIVSTKKTLTEISSICGFNNSTNFNKAFKKVTGNPPSYYRKKGQLI